MIKVRLRLLHFLMLSATTAAMAQPIEVGIAGGGMIDLHSASFTQLGQYASCCPEFSGGSGFGGWLGGGVTLPLNNRWRLSARLMYASQQGLMTYDEASFVADLRGTPTLRDAVFHHELSSTVQSIGVEPGLAFRPFGAFDAFLGFRAAYVIEANFLQTETLAKPEDYGAYLGSGRTWVEHNADIPDATAIALGMVGGLRYSIPLSRSGEWLLQPEMSVVIPFTDVANNVSWSITDLRFGIGIAKAFVPAVADTVPAPPLQQPATPSQSPIVVPDAPTAVITVQGLHNGTVVGFDTVYVEETRIVDYLPVLPYVFFEKHSSVVPQRFVRQAKTMHIGTAIGSDSQAVVSVLGTIAQRMLKSAKTTIVLTGCVTDEEYAQNSQLAKQRVDSVQMELEALGIPSSRIQQRIRRLPAMPTHSSNQQGMALADQENQRVEISPSDPSILEPIVMSTTLRTIMPDTLVVSAQANAQAGFARWQSYPAFAAPGPATHWDGEARIPATATSDSAWIEVTDSLGRNARDLAVIPVSTLTVERKLTEQRNDAEVERYSLILFGFDDATVTDMHLSVLRRIQDKVNQGAQVRILGMTDAMGSDEYNLNLSRRRAEEVAKALHVDIQNVQALGSSSPRFDNSTPEGRSYNRTVIIEVRKQNP